MRKLILLSVLLGGCGSRTVAVHEAECNIPEVIELEKFASAHELHVQVITDSGGDYHVRLWPYSEGYNCDYWAYTGLSWKGEAGLNEAIADAKDAYARNSRTIYDHNIKPKEICKK